MFLWFIVGFFWHVTNPFNILKHSLDIWHKEKEAGLDAGRISQEDSKQRPLALNSVSCVPFLVLL